MTIADAWGGVELCALPPVIAQADSEAAIDDGFAVFDVFGIGGPAFAVRRVREHEVKARTRKFIGGEGGAAFDVGRVVAFDHHVGFADGVGLVVDFFAVEVDVALGLDAAFRVGDEVLRFGEHAAGAAGGVVDGEYEWELGFERVKEQVGHELDDFARSEVLAGFFVVFFVEFADEFFEDVAHAEVGERR